MRSMHACLLPLALAMHGGEDDLVILAACGKINSVEPWGMKWAHVSSPNIPANSSFVVVDPKTEKPTTQCLNVEAWKRAPGSKVWSTTCKDEDKPKVLNRVWQIEANGSIVNPVSHNCLDIKTNGDYPIEADDTTELKSCSGKDASTWTFDVPKGSGHITHVQTGLCVFAKKGAGPTPKIPTPPPPPTPAPAPHTVNVSIIIDTATPLAHSADGYVFL